MSYRAFACIARSLVESRVHFSNRACAHQIARARTFSSLAYQTELLATSSTADLLLIRQHAQLYYDRYRRTYPFIQPSVRALKGSRSSFIND